MGIRTGKEYRESLRDGRSIYVNGERITDVTEYPPFRGMIDTLAAIYDLQHGPDQSLLCYPSPRTGEPVSTSFLPARTVEEVERRVRGEERRCDESFGLLGRLPDFCNALVTDVAAIAPVVAQSDPRLAENIVRYYELVRDHDLCLTHTLIDPQIDRSRGPSEQPDASLTLHVVRETDQGLVVRGARMLSTLAPFSNELWVGPFMPRKPGEERYAVCFAVPVATPGLKFICREPYDAGRSTFDRPLTSRFDEEDALAIFEDVVVPWERVFINGNLEIWNSFFGLVPGYLALQAIVRGMVKLRFLAGLACHIGEAIGRASEPHYQAEIGELVASAELARGLVVGCEREIVEGRQAGPLRALFAALWVFMPKAQMRAIEIIRGISGSGLVMTPTEKDFANPDIGRHIERYLQGKAVPARRRVQLFKLAWDLVGEPFGGRQLHYEWFFSGEPLFAKSRFYHSPDVATYKAMVERLLSS